MEKIFKLAYKLHDLLIESDEYKNLKDKEKIMMEDSNLSILFKELEDVEEKYANDKKDDLFKKIHELKYKIDINDLVKDYKKSYNQYMIIVDDITNICFKDLIAENDLLKEIRKILTK